jgi:hypothetical protein
VGPCAGVALSRVRAAQSASVVHGLSRWAAIPREAPGEHESSKKEATEMITIRPDETARPSFRDQNIFVLGHLVVGAQLGIMNSL